jgi:hypothetical protein
MQDIINSSALDSVISIGPDEMRELAEEQESKPGSENTIKKWATNWISGQ